MRMSIVDKILHYCNHTTNGRYAISNIHSTEREITERTRAPALIFTRTLTRRLNADHRPPVKPLWLALCPWILTYLLGQFSLLDGRMWNGLMKPIWWFFTLFDQAYIKIIVFIWLSIFFSIVWGKKNTMLIKIRILLLKGCISKLTISDTSLP